MKTDSHFDVLIVGAGLSGVGAAYHLQKRLPGKSYAILEGREALGGTWDLFRYPGVRSDSDMYTLGYSFKPWKDAKAIADGPAILEYVRETAAENGIDRHIRFQHRVTSANWSTPDAWWTVTVERGDTGETVYLTCGFLFVCSGYYRYEAGYTPDFPGASTFKGRIVHPQKWTPDIDHVDKTVIVIGSGATAVTIVPEVARTARHVTMLQRSPTYVVSRPAQDPVANWLRRNLPSKMAYTLTRAKNVLLQMYFYRRARAKPEDTKAALIHMAQKELGPDYDVGTHFTPRYNPWDQRLCLVPDSDLFKSIREGRAAVVTDHIETFTATGIRTRSGRELPADIVVTATGLDLLFLGGMEISVDGAKTDMGKVLTYKGMMYEGVPNLVSVFGYTNASWTLKCDLTCEYVCRLLKHMDRTGAKQATPRNSDPTIGEEPWLDFSSGYVQRTVGRFPRQGSRKPWKLHQNYALDIMSLRYGAVDDPAMEFKGKA
ncbi:MAG: NAD(P)/FAD-dependent oxidoreductase [Alphaproteobacteria bacterium]|nr:NAD(P)/FAD-dependent oxidoreductase [Alphaproteobacteria bacterium]